MSLPFTRARREAAERRERQVSLTESDVEDIRSISETALKATVNTTVFGGTVEITSHQSGVIVRISGACLRARETRAAIRKALEALGYVLADRDAGEATVIVTGRDPRP